MRCYRAICHRKQECDYLVAATCIYKTTKEQLNLRLSICKNTCPDCITKMIPAKYKNKNIMLCTNCNNILQKIRASMAI